MNQISFNILKWYASFNYSMKEERHEKATFYMKKIFHRTLSPERWEVGQFYQCEEWFESECIINLPLGMTQICHCISISFRLDHIFKNRVSWEKVEGRYAHKVLMGLKCSISHLLPSNECYQFGMDTQSLSGTGDSCHTAQSFLSKIIVSITQSLDCTSVSQSTVPFSCSHYTSGYTF